MLDNKTKPSLIKINEKLYLHYDDYYMTSNDGGATWIKIPYFSHYCSDFESCDVCNFRFACWTEDNGLKEEKCKIKH